MERRDDQPPGGSPELDLTTNQPPMPHGCALGTRRARPRSGMPHREAELASQFEEGGQWEHELLVLLLPFGFRIFHQAAVQAFNLVMKLL